MQRLLQVILLLTILISTTETSLSQGSGSVLGNGSWYKLEILKDGVYKLDHKFLSDIGINPASIDPRRIKIFGNGGGMLPQANNAARAQDLVENSIWVKGEDDGKFGQGDFVVFYAQGPDSYNYDGNLSYERNIYSNKNYYFLTIGTDNGLRVENAENEGSGFPKINTYNTFQYYEKESYNLLSSGREWYSESFDLTTSQTYDFNFPARASGTDIKVTSAVMAQSFAVSQFTVKLNGLSLGNQQIEAIPDYRLKAFEHDIKGRENVSQFIISSDQIAEDKLSVTVSYEKNSSGRSVGYLNYLLVEATCKLELNGSYTVFRNYESVSNANSTFEVKVPNDHIQIWDITSPLAPKNQSFSAAGNLVSFGTSTTSLKEFVVFETSKLSAPIFTSQISNQNLRAMSTPDLLIITHPTLISEANRLAAFRSSHDKLSVQVATTEQVYNEFSSGKQDLSAIRDFARHLYNKGSHLKYLLLFGKGSYDYKDFLKDNTNIVPIYESRNSLHPLFTYGSDDFYGFLEDDEGDWFEDSPGNHTLDIGIGRLPVKNTEQAKKVVDKLIRYSTDEKGFGSWRNRVLFVADDEDTNDYPEQSDQLAVLVDTVFKNFNYQKLYLDSYPQISAANGETSPQAKEALDAAVEQGMLVVNYLGHGGETGWTQEYILDLFMIESWKNSPQLPLFVTATCEFGRHDDPRRISGGEMLVTNSTGGGIALIGTCRPVYASSNFQLNKAFYKEVFRKENNEYLRLGDIIRFTKNNSVTGVNNRNFALLGDPSLRLNYPEKNIALKSINGKAVNIDTLSALSTVTVAGNIEEDGMVATSFNGELEVVVYDKESVLSTLGNGSSKHSYKSRENAVFRGKSSVTDGEFAFEFVVPKNISYKPGAGKISLYAVDNKNDTDANGADIDVVFGGSASNIDSDNTGPNIKLYMGDSTYSGSGAVGANTLLVAKISDESGINISGYGIGNNITATLDGNQTFIINEYYTASKDTYKEGVLLFPLNDLQKGKHVIKLKAWDTHNNSGEATIEFVVADPSALSLSNVITYPNPFYDYTTLSFEHNRVGETLEVNLQIISRHGEVIQEQNFSFTESTRRIELPEWNGTNNFGKKFNAGIYILKLSVRSMADGAKNQKYQKVILIN